MTDYDFLNAIPDAKKAPAAKKTSAKVGKKWTGEKQDACLEAWGVAANEREPHSDGGTKRRLKECPFCGNSSSNPAVFINKDGEAGFNCFDSDCMEKHWRDFEAHFEPKPTFEEVQACMFKALEDRDAQALYDLAPEIAQLDGKDQEVLISQVRSSKHLKGSGASVRSLQKLIAQEMMSTRASSEEVEDYMTSPDGMFLVSPRGAEKLSNFQVSIEADITTDDGAERTRSYQLAAKLHDRQRTFEVPAKDFAACTWVDEHLGARAIVTAGQSIKAHLANAIKSTSNPQEHSHYAHTGWRKIEGKMVYLHAGGALSQVSQVEKKDLKDLPKKDGATKSACEADLEEVNNGISQVSQVSQVNIGVQVKLTGNLTRYQFPTQRAEVQQAVCASLRYLDVARDSIVIPLYASLWRSVLGDLAYGVHIAGQTGFGKTELVAPLQQHFGASMSAHKLPGSWESTENALELLLFQAKDTLVVVDDFKPKGGKMDQDRLHAKADRVFRQIGNGSARGRLNSNLEQRAERRPRCLLISTGEDIPRGQSLKARGVVLVLQDRLTVGQSAKSLSIAQWDARAGLYASAMAHYIEWLAPQIEAIQAKLPDLVAEERDRLKIEGHGRAGTNTANMLIGMKYFLQFATECGAITDQEASDYLARCVVALKQTASDAERENTNDKPSEQWLRHIVTALTSKQAHLVTPKGDNPGQEYGWAMSTRTVEHAGVPMPEETYRGGGTQIGWIDGDDIFLQPEAAYKVAKAIGSQMGDEITTLEPTLRRFLAQDKVLASTSLNTKRNTVTIRRSFEKLQRDVLHIHAKILFPTESPPLCDSLDLLDYVPAEAASEEGSEVSQVPESALDLLDYGGDDALAFNDVESASEADAEVSQVPSQVDSQNTDALALAMTQEAMPLEDIPVSVGATALTWSEKLKTFQRRQQVTYPGGWGTISRIDAYGVEIETFGVPHYITGGSILLVDPTSPITQEVSA